MIIVGICDESWEDREHVKMLCERCFSQNRGIVYQFIEFPSGYEK